MQQAKLLEVNGRCREGGAPAPECGAARHPGCGPYWPCLPPRRL